MVKRFSYPLLDDIVIRIEENIKDARLIASSGMKDSLNYMELCGIIKGMNKSIDIIKETITNYQDIED